MPAPSAAPIVPTHCAEPVALTNVSIVEYENMQVFLTQLFPIWLESIPYRLELRCAADRKEVRRRVKVCVVQPGNIDIDAIVHTSIGFRASVTGRRC